MTSPLHPRHWRVVQRLRSWVRDLAMAGKQLIELSEHDPDALPVVLIALWTTARIETVVCAILYECMLDEREEMLRWP